MNSLSSATLLLGDLNFFLGGGGLFLFLTISTKRELLKITPKKISVYVKYQLFSWGGNKESNMKEEAWSEQAVHCHAAWKLFRNTPLHLPCKQRFLSIWNCF